MAAPAAAVIAKAAAAILSNDKGRKAVGWIIAAILSPVILILVFVVVLFGGGTQHNAAAVELSFHGGCMSPNTPAEFRQSVEAMQSAFADLDGAIAGINAMAEDATVDAVRVKAVYYALFFTTGGSADSRSFADSFVRYEQREREVEVDNGDGTTSTETETYEVTIPLTLPEAYANLEALLGRSLTVEDKANAGEVYHRILYGGDVPTYGADFDNWLAGLPLSTAPFVGADGFCSPLGENWRQMVTSEFGYRRDPFTGEQRGHAGIDLGASKGTQILAALPGTVYLVRYSNTGYGYHIMIDHGGFFVTLYAHCSKIHVVEDQEVQAGEVIGEVGSTGRSTGNHLHFEVIIGGEKQNPRSYLP